MTDGVGQATMTPPVDSPVLERSIGAKVGDYLIRYAVFVVLVAVIVGAQLSYSQFLDPQNLEALVRQNAQLGIIAIGMTIVIIAASFDLSVVAVYVAGAVAFAEVASSAAWPVALLAALAVGAAAGLINGAIVTRLKVNSFIATLATASIFGGLVSTYLGTTQLRIDLGGGRTLGTSEWLGVPAPIVILIALFVVGQLVLSKTVFGRSLFAVGGNPEAARLAGLPVTRVRIAAFVIVGLASALAGAIFVSSVGVVASSQVTTEGPLVLEAIAVVVVGGTSLFGGEGALWRTAAGLAIFAALSNVFSVLAVQDSVATIIKGAVVLAAVAVDAYARNRR